MADGSVELEEGDAGHRVHPVFQQARDPLRDALEFRPPAWYVALRSALITVVALILIAIGYGLYWFLSAASFRSNVVDWLESPDIPGIQIQHAKAEVGGFPFLLDIDLSELDIRYRDDQGRIWGAVVPDVVVEGSPFSFAAPTILFGGRQTWTLPASGGGSSQWRGRLGEGRLRLERGDGPLKSLDVTLVNGTFAQAGGSDRIEIGRLDLALHRLNKAEYSYQDRALDLSLDLLGLRLPRMAATPLGTGVGRLSLRGGWMGPPPSGPDRSALDAWREAGGTIEVEHLALDHGPLVLRGEGTLALDENLQPSGAFTVATEGFFAALTPFREAGWITPSAALKALVMLGAMTTRPDDAPPYLNIPASLQNRTLSVGPVALMTVPQIDWPTGTGP